ncbi:MAG: 50S ribosomal protein L6 [bacterium]|nr:50S ribosomal protein L6 [bacterium]
MSRIGKQPIQIPQGVEVKIDGNNIVIKGPNGELALTISPELNMELQSGMIIISPKRETERSKSLWGLSRTLIFNMTEGVVKAHEKKMEVQGVGYRANVEGGDLVLNVGFSHPVRIKKPEGITFNVEKNIITVSGPDKELVGQLAAKIRAVKKPEPYKGKGIRYLGEQVRRKVGKKAAGTEA